MENWSLETREETGVDIRQWIQEYTSPKLKTTGKIPRVFELRQYVIPRIIRTLEGYIDVTNHPSDRLYDMCTPKDYQSFKLLRSKLLTIYSIYLNGNVYGSK